MSTVHICNNGGHFGFSHSGCACIADLFPQMFGYPCKNFRHCSQGLWEVKSMSGIFMSSYGEKLFFLHICKLEILKSQQI